MVTKTVLKPTFIGGVLRLPGEIVEIENAYAGKKRDETPEGKLFIGDNLGPASAARDVVTYEVAAIAPHAAYPDTAQAMPSGSLQSGNRIVAPAGDEAAALDIVPEARTPRGK
jgi:hypothetical protein